MMKQGTLWFRCDPIWTPGTWEMFIHLKGRELGVAFVDFDYTSFQFAGKYHEIEHSQARVRLFPKEWK